MVLEIQQSISCSWGPAIRQSFWSSSSVLIVLEVSSPSMVLEVQPSANSSGGQAVYQLLCSPLAHQLPWRSSAPLAILWVHAHWRASGPPHWVIWVCCYVNCFWAWKSSTSGLNTVRLSLRSGCIHGAILQHTKKQFCHTLRISQMWMWENISSVVNEEQDRATPEIKGLLCLWPDGQWRSSILMEINNGTLSRQGKC